MNQSGIFFLVQKCFIAAVFRKSHILKKLNEIIIKLVI